MTKLVLWWRLLLAVLCSKSTRQFYDRIAPIYDWIFVTHSPHAQRMIEVLGTRYGGREAGTQILDLGCGTGLLTRILAAKDYEVIGLDNSFESLLVLRRRDPKVIAIQADAAFLPIADKSVQAVVCLGAWRHFEDPRRTMEEIARILVDDGTFIVGYFPPAFGGIFHWANGNCRRWLAQLYHVVIRMRGYSDRVDLQLENETLALARNFFFRVSTVRSGNHWNLLVALKPNVAKSACHSES